MRRIRQWFARTRKPKCPFKKGDFITWQYPGVARSSSVIYGRSSWKVVKITPHETKEGTVFVLHVDHVIYHSSLTIRPDRTVVEASRATSRMEDRPDPPPSKKPDRWEDLDVFD